MAHRIRMTMNLRGEVVAGDADDEDAPLLRFVFVNEFSRLDDEHKFRAAKAALKELGFDVERKWKWLVMLDDALRPVPLPKPEEFGTETAGWTPLVPSSWWDRGVRAEQRWQSKTAEYSSPPDGTKYRSGSRALHDLYATETEALLAGCYMLKDMLCEHIATTLERMEGK